MDIGLQELYRRIQLAPAITTFLPEEIGKGEITRISTNNGYQASSWDLVYDREAEVNGMVREGFRLLFCMGEGIEWMSDHKGMQLAVGEACFCMDASACVCNRKPVMRRCQAAGRRKVDDRRNI